MHLPLENKQRTTLRVCMLLLLKQFLQKRMFYTNLHHMLQKVPAEVIILGAFNARVGWDSDTWKGVLGRHGVASCNNNGRFLLEFCAEQQLTITNTIFQQGDSLKTTWIHPWYKHWHLVDFVLVRQRDIRDVLHT